MARESSPVCEPYQNHASDGSVTGTQVKLRAVSLVTVLGLAVIMPNVGFVGTAAAANEPTITSFSATTPGAQDVKVSFDSDEQLSTIDVSISNAESGSLSTADFTESGSGPYTYTATYEGSTNGTYDATLNTGADSDGNDGASGQSDSVKIYNVSTSVGTADTTLVETLYILTLSDCPLAPSFPSLSAPVFSVAS